MRDVTRSAAEIMKSIDAGLSIEKRYRPMRGQAYVQMLERRSSILIDPGEDPRDHKGCHRGRIFALGPPARLAEHAYSPVVPWDCKVGDEIVFNLFTWLDKFRTMRLFGVDGLVMVVAQGEIHGVVE